MRQVLVRNLVLMGVGIVAALIIGVAATAQDVSEANPPAQLDRTFDEADAVGQPAVPSEDLGTGIGGSGPVGTPRRNAPDAGVATDGGTGGSGYIQMEDESVEPQESPEGSPQGKMTPQQQYEQQTLQDPHTDILMYGPNGLRDSEEIPEHITGGTETGTGGAGNEGTEATDDGGGQGGHTNIEVYGPNGGR